MTHRRLSPRAIAIDVSLTVTSIVVLLIAALYVVAPPRPSMATEVTTSVTTGTGAVVYGSVLDTADRPVKGATVVVSRQNGGTLERVLSLTAAADGTFKGDVPSPSGTYRITVSADVGGITARDTMSLALEPGRSYGIKAELTDSSYFVFLPIPSY